MKIVNNILDKKIIIASITTFALEFFQSENRKHSDIDNLHDSSATSPIFIINKVKIVKDKLDEKSLATSIVDPKLKF